MKVLSPVSFTRISTSALLLLSLASLGSAQAVPGAAATRAAVSQPAPIGIDNFGQVSATYYRGAQPQGRDYADLAALGVKTVINLTSHDAMADEQELVEAAGMKYVALPMTTRVNPTPEQLAAFLAIVNDATSGPVFVHCVGGKHRTGVMTAVYRMTQHEWTGDRAFKEMKQFKFGADFLHPEFKTFVLGYRVPGPALAPEAVSVSTD
jgi:uncharacterized protein (TIGR01244 family)